MCLVSAGLLWGTGGLAEEMFGGVTGVASLAVASDRLAAACW